MKKWYDEDYEWEIEVIESCVATAQRTIAEIARKLEISQNL